MCCGASNKKSKSQRRSQSISSTQNNAISQKLADQIRQQNGQSVTPIRKQNYRMNPQYRYM